jgi:hypothetical protein
MALFLFFFVATVAGGVFTGLVGAEVGRGLLELPRTAQFTALRERLADVGRAFRGVAADLVRFFVR